MTRLRGRWPWLVVLVVAAAALVTSVGWAAGQTRRWSPAGRMPVLSGRGPVHNLDQAANAAERFADRSGLRVGEVMQFSENFYAELLDPAGHRATEVLVDPASGTVSLEYGPAMMWNTRYGMRHRAMMGGTASNTVAISPDQARQIADKWLRDNQPGLHAGDAELFPGYYTLHTLRGDQVVGMLSVNAATGAVWYHSWHGTFIRMRE
jgi:hypothetical protein